MIIYRNLSTIIKAFALLFVSLSIFYANCASANSHAGGKEKKETDIKTKVFKSLDKDLDSYFLAPNSFNSVFNDDFLRENFKVATNDSVLISEAKNVINKLDETNNYIDKILRKNLVTLPVGIKTRVGDGGIGFTMGISEAKFRKDYTEVKIFVRITIPQKDQTGKQRELFFGADNVKISSQGGIYGDANLSLLGDVPIPFAGGNTMMVLKSGFDKATNTINKDKSTYVKIDCEGFKELGLSADIVFSEKRIQPVDNEYKVIPNERVKASFNTVVTDWNNILVNINLPRFQVSKGNTSANSNSSSGQGGLIFEIDDAVLDFSDKQNSVNVVFPAKYDQYLINGSEETWRGVYVNKFKVILPQEFKSKKSDERLSFEATDLLIDGRGISGNFSSQNLLPLAEGDASKWQFSVDYFEASIVTNQLIRARFQGYIVLPISKQVSQSDLEKSDSTELNKRALKYKALINPTDNEYLLTVKNQGNLDFAFLKAKATLSPNSYIELKSKGGKFKAKAVLHGTLEIGNSQDNTTNKRRPVNIKKVTFNDMQLQSEYPHFQVGYMGYEGDVTLAKFPVTISEISISSNNDQISLNLTTTLNMMSKGIAGSAGIKFISEFKETGEGGYQRWSYKKIEISKIRIEADLGQIKLKGSVDIKRDDPVYGNGFYGTLEAVFNDKITVTTTAWFGKKEFRYWYVDAYADLSKLPTKPMIGPLNIDGFGGGAYYKMTRAGGNQSAATPSGLAYVPSKDTGLGFRALLGISLPKKQAFNGKVSFEMEFNSHGGLNRVLFFGEAHMMKPIGVEFGDQFKNTMKKVEEKVNKVGDNLVMQKLKSANLVEYGKANFPQNGMTFDVAIDAYFAMEMDFENGVFHSEMEVFMNSPGGVFSGVGQNGRAGWAIFHISQDKWYIHIGTPKDRLGFKFGVGDANLSVTAYLMIGHDLPGSPPPPSEVAEILGLDVGKLDYMRDLNELGNGRGFAFGMDFSVDTGNMSFLMFYARFQAGLGFDIMVKDYGEAACKGRGQIGIGGWYANGQAYVYLQGELGINIKLFAVRKKIPIIKAGAAVLLQAKLPNPSWFKGYVGGYFDLLGGLVKGKFRFMVELGEECELVGPSSPLGDLKIISDITPSDNSKEIDVFTAPQVAFNMAINKSFDFEDDEGLKTYRILMDEFMVSQEGRPINGEIEWNSGQDIANFLSYDILPPNTSIKLVVKVSFQEQKNGRWETILENGKPAQEIQELSFTTGEAPNYIPKTNIAYCYPIIDQQYFYQDESNTGYISLKKGQPNLFAPATDWTQKIIFEGEGASNRSLNINYDKTMRLVTFDLDKLNNQEEYVLKIVSTPPKQENSDNSLNDNYQATTIDDSTSISVRNRTAETVVNESTDTELLTYKFATSSYNTFAEKVNSKVPTKHLLDPIFSNVHSIETNTQKSEQFSLSELVGSKETGLEPMIQVEATLNDNYFKNIISPLIYKDYPYESDLTVDRDITEMGFPPKKAVELISWIPYYLEFEPTDYLLSIRMPYRYNLPYYYKLDFDDIQYKIVNKYLPESSSFPDEIEKYKKFITKGFPAIRRGNYSAYLTYMMPGGRKGTKAKFTYFNQY